MIERKLDDIATANGFWKSVSSYTLVHAEEGGLDAMVDFYADFIAMSVVKGFVDVKDVRDEAEAFNDLDAQVADVAGNINELEGADYIEGMSRRIVHHVLREGLDRVKTQDDRIAWKNARPFWKRGEEPMPGMGRLELHDIQALREEAEQVELGKE